MATHSSILAWKIPWTEEPGRLQSMQSQRVGCDWACAHAHAPTHTKPWSIIREWTLKSGGQLGTSLVVKWLRLQRV